MPPPNSQTAAAGFYFDVDEDGWVNLARLLSRTLDFFVISSPVKKV
jgi:hypothetical protein